MANCRGCKAGFNLILIGLGNHQTVLAFQGKRPVKEGDRVETQSGLLVSLISTAERDGCSLKVLYLLCAITDILNLCALDPQYRILLQVPCLLEFITEPMTAHELFFPFICTICKLLFFSYLSFKFLALQGSAVVCYITGSPKYSVHPFLFSHFLSPCLRYAVCLCKAVVSPVEKDILFVCWSVRRIEKWLHRCDEVLCLEMVRVSSVEVMAVSHAVGRIHDSNHLELCLNV